MRDGGADDDAAAMGICVKYSICSCATHVQCVTFEQLQASLRRWLVPCISICPWLAARGAAIAFPFDWLHSQIVCRARASNATI